MKLERGPGVGAARAAYWRKDSRKGGDYYVAVILEMFYGETRHWDERGRTWTRVFEPTMNEFDKRIVDGD